MPNETQHFYEFGPFRIATGDRLLLRDGEVIPLSPKVFDMLLLLVEHRGHVMEKDALMRTLWPDSFVEEGSLSKNVFVLRKVLRERPNGQEYTQTIPKRGYRFVAEVRGPPAASLVVEEHSRSRLVIHQEDLEAGPRRRYWIAAVMVLTVAVAAVVAWFVVARKRDGATVAPKVTSLLVLPLKNIGSDSGVEYLSDGITDELIAKLANLDNVRVVSRSVAMRFKHSSADAADLGRQVGVAAVLDGTLRISGNRLRVGIHLVNAQNGFESWADDSFDGDLNDILGFERQLAEKVAIKLKGPLTAQERSLVAKQSTRNAEAYELLLRGKEHARNIAIAFGGDPSDQPLARQMFERAIQLDTPYADAYGWLALVLYYQFHDGNAPLATLDQAIAPSNRALSLDPNLVIARRALIHIYHSTSQTKEGLEQAKLIRQSSAANDPDALEAAALAYFRAGLMDRAIPLYEKALVIDPLDEAIRNGLARCYIYTHPRIRLAVLFSLLERKQGGEWVAMPLYLALGEYRNAIEAGERCHDRIGAVWYDRGRVLTAAGQPSRARQVWLAGVGQLGSQGTLVENVPTGSWLGIFSMCLGDPTTAPAQPGRR